MRACASTAPVPRSRTTRPNGPVGRARGQRIGDPLAPGVDGQPLGVPRLVAERRPAPAVLPSGRSCSSTVLPADCTSTTGPRAARSMSSHGSPVAQPVGAPGRVHRSADGEVDVRPGPDGQSGPRAGHRRRRRGGRVRRRVRTRYRRVRVAGGVGAAGRWVRRRPARPRGAARCRITAKPPSSSTRRTASTGRREGGRSSPIRSATRSACPQGRRIGQEFAVSAPTERCGDLRC